jgi:hypothetical protein
VGSPRAPDLSRAAVAFLGPCIGFRSRAIAISIFNAWLRTDDGVAGRLHQTVGCCGSFLRLQPDLDKTAAWEALEDVMATRH